MRLNSGESGEEDSTNTGKDAKRWRADAHRPHRRHACATTEARRLSVDGWRKWIFPGAWLFWGLVLSAKRTRHLLFILREIE